VSQGSETKSFSAILSWLSDKSIITPLQALHSVHVNIRQFLETTNKPAGVLFFRHVRELQDWTINHHYFWPRRKM
jgi:hypothetical protein